MWLRSKLVLKYAVCMYLQSIVACLLPESQGDTATTEHDGWKVVSRQINVCVLMYCQSAGHYMQLSLDHLGITAETTGI